MRVLLLISGGLDSPVAGCMLQEAGHDVAGLHFSQEPFTDSSPEQKSRDCARALGFSPLYVAHAGQAFSELTKQCEHRMYFVLSKRLMLKAAGALASREGFDAVVTGENLGQVSSQTLQNLTCVHAATDIPVITPLLALDKEEIVSIAKEIGTYELSTGPEMCDALGPDHPATAAKLEAVLEQEARLDIDRFVDEMLADDGLVRDELTAPA